VRPEDKDLCDEQGLSKLALLEGFEYVPVPLARTIFAAKSQLRVA
jgi:hypothetical protein